MVRELGAQEQAQVEAVRRLNRTPLEICLTLGWAPEAYLPVVRRHCQTLPRRYGVGVWRPGADGQVDRSTTKPRPAAP